VIENGVVKQTAIQTGEKEGKFIEVLGGLKGDEILAASNLNELVSGTKIGAGGDEEGGPAPGSAPAAEGGQRRGGKGGGSGGKGGGGKRGSGERKGNAQ